MRNYEVVMTAATTSRRPKKAVEDLRHAQVQTAVSPIRASGDLLRLQRRYGNRYVRCVISLSRQDGGEASGGPEVKQFITASAVPRLEQQSGPGAQAGGRLSRQFDSKDEEKKKPMQLKTQERWAQRLGDEEEQLPATPTALLEESDHTGTGTLAGEPMEIESQSASLGTEHMNEDGLLDGDLSSEVAPHVFMDGGRTGQAMVHWAGGGGGRGNQGVGDITIVAPVIDTSKPPAAGGVAHAWVRVGTGTVTVTRSYTGVLTGANGPSYYLTARASARVDRHERLHVASSLGLHNTHIKPLEQRVAMHMGVAKALSHGATEAEARAALIAFIDWNRAVTAFRNADIAANQPGGTVDTADMAAADFIRDYGRRTLRGVTYHHYVDTPPGP